MEFLFFGLAGLITAYGANHQRKLNRAAENASLARIAARRLENQRYLR